MRTIIKVGIVMGSVTVGLAAYAAVAIHRANMAGTQIRNFIQLQVHIRALEQFRSEHGVYPKDLATVVAAEPNATGDRRYLNGLDLWGHPLILKTDKSHFILVSLGRDGRPDGRSNPGFGAPPELDKAPCGDNTLDSVVSEAGVHRGCFK
jgi:hypothetical protein